MPCLESHKPFDLITIMLGTNDLKCRFSVSAFDIAESVGVLVRHVQQSQAGPQENAPIPLVIAPPPLAKLKEFEEMFKGASEKSKLFGKYYRKKPWKWVVNFWMLPNSSRAVTWMGSILKEKNTVNSVKPLEKR